MKALSIKAQDRFQSMEDFKGALNGNIVEAPPPVIDPGSRPYRAARGKLAASARLHFRTSAAAVRPHRR